MDVVLGPERLGLRLQALAGVGDLGAEDDAVRGSQAKVAARAASAHVVLLAVVVPRLALFLSAGRPWRRCLLDAARRAACLLLFAPLGVVVMRVTLGSWAAS